jgi:AbrB family looped-hinge helix DNA binding protein
METTTVSAKGWIVIPAGLRRKYGIKPGDQVRIVDYGGVLSVIPAMTEPIKEAAGMLHGGPSLTHAIVEDHVRDREHEQ